MLGLIISLITGAAGGNVAGALLKGKSLGTLGNSIAGIAGGGVLGSILPMLGMGGGGEAVDIMSIIQSGASGLVGGGGLMAIIGALRGNR